MKKVKLRSLLIFLALFCLVGCSSLHVKVDPDTEWDAVSTVTLQGPQEDPWGLRPAILAELEQMGLQTLTDESVRPDLHVRYFFQQVLDMNEENQLFNRLQSLHVQFAKPGTETLVAVADYFYDVSSTDPEKGVEAVFVQLRQDIRSGGSPVLRPVPSTQEDRSAVPPAVQENRMTEKMKPTEAATAPSASRQEAHDADAESAGRGADKAPAGNMVESKTRSPWIPRFKSWGFEEWGKEDNDDFY